MPFGQPVQGPTETLACGCIVMGWSDADRSVMKHCATHWAELPDEDRQRIERERRRSLFDGLLGLALRGAVLGLAAFMVWYVWRRLGG